MTPFLALFRVPYLLTNGIQEDAFISWRCARTLARTGVIGFNAGERVSASTSHAYVILTAAVIKVVGENFIPAIQAINCVMSVAGLYLLATTLLSGRRALLLWLIVGVLPMSVVVSTAGMETSLLMLLIGIAVRFGGAERCGPRILAAIALGLMPWTRPDAVSYAGLIWLYIWWRRRRFPLGTAAWILLSVVAIIVFNKLYFGQVIFQTMRAKVVTYAPSHSLHSIGTGFALLLWGDPASAGLFQQLDTKYVQVFRWPIFLAGAGAFAYIAWSARRGDDLGKIKLLLIAFALVVPFAYVVGGVVFPWYVWPARVIATMLIVALGIEWFSAHPIRSIAIRRGSAVAFILALTLLGIANWISSYSWGSKEYGFRGSIGRDLKHQMSGTDTLFLEPAGYIPFFADCRTIDMVGLVSPVVTEYQLRYGLDRWCFEFLKQEQPTVVVQKRAFYTSSELDSGKHLSPDERRQFDALYVRTKLNDYDPAEFNHTKLTIAIARLGGAPSYDVYWLRSALPGK